MIFTNSYKKEFKSYLDFLEIKYTQDLEQADKVYIDLEKFVFKYHTKESFTRHKHSLNELNTRFNDLLTTLHEVDKRREEAGLIKQYRYLFVSLPNIKEAVANNKKLYDWSYFSHKYTMSKGKDTKAMDIWHKLEKQIDSKTVAQFKALREVTLSFFINVVKNHLFFSNINFGVTRQKKAPKDDFGLDVAEEIYINKTIQDYHAKDICSIIPAFCANPLTQLTKSIIKEYKLDKLKVNLISNSRQLNAKTQFESKLLLAYLGFQEVPLQDANFVILVNDLDLLTMIPELDTEKPIIISDISAAESPNFAYLLLKDGGFAQVYSYSKRRFGESSIFAILRALAPGLISLGTGEKFLDQIAINYMDDYFAPLSLSQKTKLQKFLNPINLLVERLEKDDA